VGSLVEEFLTNVLAAFARCEFWGLGQQAQELQKGWRMQDAV